MPNGQKMTGAEHSDNDSFIYNTPQESLRSGRQSNISTNVQFKSIQQLVEESEVSQTMSDETYTDPVDDAMDDDTDSTPPPSSPPSTPPPSSPPSTPPPSSPPSSGGGGYGRLLMVKQANQGTTEKRNPESRVLDIFGPNLIIESNGPVGVGGALAYQLFSITDKGIKYQQALHASGLATIEADQTLEIQTGRKINQVE